MQTNSILCLFRKLFLQEKQYNKLIQILNPKPIFKIDIAMVSEDEFQNVFLGNALQLDIHT